MPCLLNMNKPAQIVLFRDIKCISVLDLYDFFTVRKDRFHFFFINFNWTSELIPTLPYSDTACEQALRVRESRKEVKEVRKQQHAPEGTARSRAPCGWESLLAGFF